MEDSLNFKIRKFFKEHEASDLDYKIEVLEKFIEKEVYNTKKEHELTAQDLNFIQDQSIKNILKLNDLDILEGSCLSRDFRLARIYAITQAVMSFLSMKKITQTDLTLHTDLIRNYPCTHNRVILQEDGTYKCSSCNSIVKPLIFG